MQNNSIEIKKSRYVPGRLEMYGFWGYLQLIYLTIVTKLIVSDARLFRLPVEIRGKRHIDFGKNLSLGKGCKIEAYPYVNQGIIITFGKNVGINDYSHITGVNRITIGDNVLMAGKIYISDSNHGSYSGDENDSDPESIIRFRPVSGKPITIEENVWLGEFVSVLSGVTIGKCSIIGAHSVVTKDIPPYTIAIGIPAMPIKRFDFETKKWIKL